MAKQLACLPRDDKVEGSTTDTISLLLILVGFHSNAS